MADTDDVNSKNDNCDELTCALCLEGYTDPVLLPCFHSFCKVCVDQLVTGNSGASFNCPLCRTEIESRNDFLANFYLKSKVSIRNRMIKCELCEYEKEIKLKCTNCDQFLCDSCSAFHLKLKSCKDHKVIEFNKTGIKIKANSSYCSKHIDEILRFYCKQCEEVICRDCKLTAHEGHKSEDIQDRIDREKLALQAHNTGLDFDISCHDNQLHMILNLRTLVENKTINSTQSLDILENQIITSVKNQFAELKSDLQVATKQSVQLLDERKKTITNISRKRSEKNYIEQVVHGGITADIIQLKLALSTSRKQESNSVGPIQLKVPTFSPTNEKLVQLIGTSCFHKQIEDIQWGLSLSLTNTFVCNVFNKSVSSICLKSENEAIVSFRHDTVNHRTFNRDVIWYKSSGKIEGAYGISAPEDICMDNTQNEIYFYDRRFEGISTLPLTLSTTVPNDTKERSIWPCKVSISIDVFPNGDTLILEGIEKKLTRMDFATKKKYDVTFDENCFVSPTKVACDGDDVWVADPGASLVVVLDKNGQIKFKIDVRTF